jgi:peptidoglycan/LPS O-acetylase OafA/YrhL
MPRRPAARRRLHGELPALDGIRAVAVLAVMFYHFGVTGSQGGFLGVDVFFVLSGYLITGQLVTRWVLGGQVSLRRFWLARARRLLPGLGALLLGTTTAALVFDRSQVRLFRGDVTAAATYSSNWWYIFHQRSYFVASGRPPLLQHLWSLAVEEQFYLVWPLVVVAVVMLCRNVQARRWVLLAVALSLALASSLVMALGSAASSAPQAGDPSRWYFGTDSHAMGLLIGAALALLRWGDQLGAARIVARRPANTIETVAGTAALMVLLYTLSQTDQFSVWLYRWGFVAVSLLAAVVVATATRPGPLAAVLSPPVLRGIGKRSYALYLWHWPVACFTRPGLDLPLPGSVVLLIRLGATFALACASYRWIERPVREFGWARFWSSVSRLRIGALRAPTIVTACVTAMFTAVMLPAGASTAGPHLASSGAVYVPGIGSSRTTRPPSSKSGHAAGSQSPSGNGQPSQPHLPGIQQPTVRQPSTPDDENNPGGHPVPTAPPTRASQLRDYNLVVYGDSVALGAVSDLATRFRSVTNHAVEGIQAWSLLPEVKADASAGRLDGDIVLIHTGDNGIISKDELTSALQALHGAARVILVEPYVPREWQSDNLQIIQSMAGGFSKVILMPWGATAQAHSEYLWDDGIHLTPTGERAYTDMVATAAVTER